ncbi:hypothetical protein [Nocardioides jensenii]|uniref:hypothetical protein n=1 Tax=Nocardioides jensenii TaxID=1843 RepID=UPI0008318167|nr:hypothetical protein [Nocardioides jensenii]
MAEELIAIEGRDAPDAFMREAHRTALRVAVRRQQFATLVNVLALGAGLVVVFLWRDSWTITLPVALAVALVGACCGFPPSVNDERPVPETELEVARLLDSTIRTWGGSRDGEHRVRLTGEDSSGRLVHGEVWLRADGGCEPPFGALFGFRRHPTMRQLVHIEQQTDRLDLDRLEVRARIAQGLLPDDAAEALDTGMVTEAEVTDLEVGDDVRGLRSHVRLELRLSDGSATSATAYLLPEELGDVAPGSTVRIARGRRDAVLLGTSAGL